jgi:ATP-binding cassette subfamily C protein
MVNNESAFWSLRQMIEEAKQATERSPHGLVTPLKSCVSLAGIEVAYQDNIILTNLSLEIPAGMFTALIGPSGAGQTTVVDLVTG